MVSHGPSKGSMVFCSGFRLQGLRKFRLQGLSGCRVGQKLSRLCGSNGFKAVGIGLFMQGSIIPIPAVQR